MYKAHYINPLIQYGRKEFTLLIEDDENILPPYRMGASFLTDATDEAMAEHAKNVIDSILEEPLPVDTTVSTIVDMPEGIE